jgi:hypothetical protein
VSEGASQRLAVTGNIMTDWGRKLPKKKSPIDLGRARSTVVRDNIVSP